MSEAITHICYTYKLQFCLTSPFLPQPSQVRLVLKNKLWEFMLQQSQKGYSFGIRPNLD